MIDSVVCIPVPTKEFMRLCLLLDNTKSTLSPSKAIEAAIDYWIDNAAWKPDLLRKGGEENLKGYQWKGLFLPSGTQLRMRYKAKDYYAKVIGDQIEFENEFFTPSQLANKIADGSARNAWRDFYIKRPTDNTWVLADDLR